MVWVPLGVPLNEYWKSHYQLIRVYWESHWKSYSQVLLNENPMKHIGNNWLSIRIRLDESYWTYHCISSDNLLKSLWESPFEMSHCKSSANPIKSSLRILLRSPNERESPLENLDSSWWSSRVISDESYWGSQWLSSDNLINNLLGVLLRKPIVWQS